jgi:diaminohydroxyphosphoribosylaminopyrimidine deaminase / 5-amino-6-(5-phosphoribosylamino)uracil reductase
MADDQRLMELALQQARRGRGLVEPNPMVGCVIAVDGQVVASGYHEKFGGPHAEVNALGRVANDIDLKKATAYVTLEPCCHSGKTPPCTDALIRSGIGRVVVGTVDPFPKVDGSGIRLLKQAGIEVVVGVCKEEASRLIAPFAKQIKTGYPWVIAKWAMTIDGRIATVTGESQWITGTRSREDVHDTRGRVDAIVIGMGTVRSDDPMLTARPPGPRTPARVVFCRHKVPSMTSQLVRTLADAPLVLVASPKTDHAELNTLQAAGAQIVSTSDFDSITMVQAAMDYFASKSWTNIVVEGGGELLASFFAADAIDACEVYLGAKLFGGRESPGPVGGAGIPSISQSPRFELEHVATFDSDVKLSYRRSRG